MEQKSQFQEESQKIQYCKEKEDQCLQREVIKYQALQIEIQQASKKLLQLLPIQKYNTTFNIFKKLGGDKNITDFFKPGDPISPQDQEQLSSIEAFNRELFSQNYKSTQCNRIFSKFNRNAGKPKQFTYNCSKVTQNCTLVAFIKPVNKQICNITVHNASGFVFAYFEGIKLSKKFEKVQKLIKRIKVPTLLIVHNQVQHVQKEDICLRKLLKSVSQFCYFTNSEGLSYPPTFNKKQLKTNKPTMVAKGQFCSLSKDSFFLCSQIYLQNDYQSNIQKTKEFAHKVEKMVHHLLPSRYLDQPQARLIFECLYINLSLDSIENNAYSHKQVQQKIINVFEKESEPVKKKKNLPFGDPDNHYLEITDSCRECIHCSAIRKTEDKTKRSSKYRCEGCSAEQRKDINLCIDCAKAYHNRKWAIQMRKEEMINKGNALKKNSNIIEQQSPYNKSLFQGQQIKMSTIQKEASDGYVQFSRVLEKINNSKTKMFSMLGEMKNEDDLEHLQEPFSYIMNRNIVELDKFKRSFEFTLRQTSLSSL